MLSIIIALAYGGTYWKLNYSFLGAEQRTTVLFIVAAIIPATAIGTLPFYHNGAAVSLLLSLMNGRYIQVGVHLAL